MEQRANNKKYSDDQSYTPQDYIAKTLIYNSKLSNIDKEKRSKIKHIIAFNS